MEQHRDDQAALEKAVADDESGATLREGITRRFDEDRIDTLRSERDLVEEEPVAARDTAFDAGRELEGPPDLRESIDVADVAPDGTALGGGGLTSPTGDAIGGSGLSDAVESGASGLGGDALGRGIDFDLTAAGTNDSGPGGSESTGDAEVDQAIMGHDGSLFSADPKKLKVYDEQPSGGTPAKDEGNWFTDAYKATKEFLTGTPTDGGTPPVETHTRTPSGKEAPGWTPDPYMENPDADSGESVTNLERVTVMQDSRTQPSTNPDDPTGGDGSTENWIPPADLETMPVQDGEATDATLTSTAVLGSSPVTNPSDPILGDDGVIGGAYGGTGGDTLDSMTAMTSETSAAAEESAASAAPASVAAPAIGREVSSIGGVVSQGDEDDGGEDDGVQSMGAPDDAALAIGASDPTFSSDALGAPGGLEGPPPVGEDGPLPGEDS